MSACRQAQVQGPQILPTASPTPRSTALPPVPTTLPPGTDDNPIRMVIKPAGAARLITETQIDEFQTALAADSDLVIEVVLVERYAEALEALCGSTADNQAVAWLDGISYQAAVLQRCGQPSLMVERGGRGRQATVGEAVHVVAGPQLSSASINALVGRNFCRIGPEDYISWLLPSLMMRANGLDPLNALDSILDFDRSNQIMDAVLEGECAAAMSDSDYEALSDDESEEITVLETSPDFPYAIMLYPTNFPLGERIRLEDALLAADSDSEGRSAMQPFLDQDGLRRVNSEAFEDLAEFLDDTGMDFALLGG